MRGTTPGRSAAAAAAALLVLCSDSRTGHAQSGSARAFVAITPGGSLDASTYKQDAFRVRNDSGGTIRIAKVSIDLKTAILPDMVYDPDGIAGDVVAKCFDPASGDVETGLVAPADPCASPFSSVHDDGYDRIALAFTDFDPGEVFTFAVDVDPTSIRGATGSGAAGSVSGLELSGARVTVQFANGQDFAGRMFHELGTNGGALVSVGPGAAAAPTLDALDVDEPASTDDAAQTIRVSAAPGASVRLLRLETALVLEAAEGFDLDAFEGNAAVVVEETNAAIGGGGFADVPVTLTRQSNIGGLNYFIAAAVDENGRTGTTSNVVVLELGQGCFCGAPASHAPTPLVSDALYILRATIGSEECDPCECDVDGNGSINATDALLDLRLIVGLPAELVCSG